MARWLHRWWPGQYQSCAVLWAESLAAAPEGSCSGGRVRYHRREPEHTVLHQLVRENLASFMTEVAERYPSGELPPFIH